MGKKKKQQFGPEVPASSRYTMISSGMGEHIALKPGTEGKEPEIAPASPAHKTKAVDKTVKKPTLKGVKKPGVGLYELSLVPAAQQFAQLGDKLAAAEKLSSPEQPGYLHELKSALASGDLVLDSYGTFMPELPENPMASADDFVAGSGVAAQAKAKQFLHNLKVSTDGTVTQDVTAVEDVYQLAKEPVTFPYLGSPSPEPLSIENGAIVTGKAFEPDSYPQAAPTLPDPETPNYLDDMIRDNRRVDNLEIG